MCLHPIKAWYSKCFDERGVRHLFFTPPSDFESFVRDFVALPCGKCLGCLDDRRKRWINRLLLEFDVCGKGSFITLTYANSPEKPLVKDVQDFLKRFRNIPRDYNLSPFPKDFKYFFCGERGGKNGRPHYHGLLFGLDLLTEEWQPYIASFKDGSPLISSRILERKWRKGFCTVDCITSNRCRYVAKYTLKQEGQEDCFTLKSPRLGVGQFFDYVRDGRKVKYSYKYPDSAVRLLDGNIHVQDKERLLNVRIPPSILRYVERIDPDLSLDISLMRQLDALDFRRKKFDETAYVARLIDENKKQKLKRKLHT